MTNRSVAAAPLSDNDVLMLSSLFEVSIAYFRTHYSSQAKDFIHDLRALAGLGFTAALADGGDITPYQIYLKQFVEVERSDFIQARHRPASAWSAPLSNMVALGLESFRYLDYPDYSREFNNRLEKILNNVRIDLVGKREEAKHILSALPSRGRLL